ncbi:MAG: CoA pyrophosphatase [Bacteroidetes bacterium]|jgi:8-oxo-dGTP pyrophosphatase MutT (NUDIX family)|nr:CoA pyrophosphatase [Bacteroidota bacterium]
MKNPTPVLPAFIRRLQLELQKPLPGIIAHRLMEPATRRSFKSNWSHPTSPRQSAVLILLFPENEDIKTIFIQRNIYDGVHSGQIAFPGGRYELFDKNLINTALRETEEEVGVATTAIHPIGQLTKIYIPPSNFDVLPVVGWTSKAPILKLDPTEVSAAFCVSLSQLIDPVCKREEEIMLSNKQRLTVPCFTVDDKIIWGATSMILNEFVEIISPIYNIA